jgi:hypothetical protein
MFPYVDLIATLGGLIVSPLYDFIKKKFIPEANDTPERTISTLATTSPEALEGYTKGLADYLDAQVDYFNRDVIGEVSKWVRNLRAAIRPIGVCIAFVILAWMAYLYITGEITRLIGITGAEETLTGIRLSCEIVITSWFGHRITIKDS